MATKKRTYKVVNTPAGDVPAYDGTEGFNASSGAVVENGKLQRPSYIKPKQEKTADVSGNETLTAMARELREITNQKKDLEATLKEINIKLDALSNKLGEQMESLSVKNLRVDGVGLVYIEIKNRPSILDKDGFIAWLDEQGMGDIAKRTVHPARLESLVKELLENAQPLPPSLNNYQQPRARLRK